MKRYPARKSCSKKPPSITDKERFDYAWKHFALIADQRIKTFNFYIIVLLAAFGGTISNLVRSDLPRHDFCLIGFAHICAAVIFWAIDSRSCRMLQVAVDALTEIESSPAFEGKIKLMLEDRKRNKHGLWHLLSYRVAFKATFVLQLIFGFALALNPSAFSSALKSPPSPQLPVQLHTAPVQPAEKQKGCSYEFNLKGSDHTFIF
ncbi:hypothetical protein [Prosthecobacter sp.]|uniref:hypothetical protein n=1 Tax=Prosthecobacter sp. TaxID=1965333 RepID=UPI0037831261